MTTETKPTGRPVRHVRTLVFGLLLAALAYGANDAIRYVYQAY